LPRKQIIYLMLKKILSVSGKPGLYKLISQGKNLLIAESLTDGKRIPVYMHEKVVSLSDIAIYTTDNKDLPLKTVLKNIWEKEQGKVIDFDKSISPINLKKYFVTILPNFDQDRVYSSDIRKIMTWYNILVTVGQTDFLTETEEEAPKEDDEAAPENV